MNGFDYNLILGQVGENTVCRRLRAEGFSIERNCDGAVVDGRGPSMFGGKPDGPGEVQIPRPDLAASLRGVSVPLEVKTKTDRTTGRLTGDEETGIDYKRWIDYRSYEQQTGLPVALIIVEYTFPGVANWIKHHPRVQQEYRDNGRVTRTEPPDAIFGAWLHDLKPSLNTPTVCCGREMIYFAIGQFTAGWIDMLDGYVRKHATRLV